MTPENPELLAALRELNENLALLTELQALPPCDMVLHRTILATRAASTALESVQAWRDALLMCARMEAVH